ncbi:MAG: hypothetical protein IH934_07920 [Nanoarchaeota archaeon]|nr:hypothetical protein [Nanoarchaeota archaeon]
MKKSLIFIFVLSLIVVYGCASSGTITYKQGVKRINEIDENFGATMKTPPDSTEKIDGLLIQIIGFAASNENMPKSLEYLLDFRIKSLEADKLHIEGWQWGRGSTTDWGFGCRKGSARVLNSSKIRNSSAQKGFEAIDTLQLLVDEFPNEAKSVNLSQKDVLFLNAAYYQIEKKARRDSIIIRSLCKEQIKELNITI